MTPKLSIIVPTYNVKPWLCRCVDSVLAQTCTDFELLLIDDGSTDGSGEVCDACAASDARVKAIHQPNQGPSAARNTGLDAASGDYIGFMDGDDYIDASMYGRLLELLLKHNADIAVCGYTQFDDETGDVLARFQLPNTVQSGKDMLKAKLYEGAGGFGCFSRSWRSSMPPLIGSAGWF